MTRATVNIDSKSINSSLTRRAAFAGVALLAAPSTALAVCVAPDGTHPIEPSWFALTGLAIYVIASSNAGSPMRRGALVFLAITVPMCWGPFFLHVFSRPFLWSDALFVSNLIGTEQIGNLVKVCRRFRILSDISAMLILPQHVTRFIGVDLRHPVRQTQEFAAGYLLVSPCGALGTSRKRDTNRTHGTLQRSLRHHS